MVDPGVSAVRTRAELTRLDLPGLVEVSTPPVGQHERDVVGRVSLLLAVHSASLVTIATRHVALRESESVTKQLNSYILTHTLHLYHING